MYEVISELQKKVCPQTPSLSRLYLVLSIR